MERKKQGVLSDTIELGSLNFFYPEADDATSPKPMLLRSFPEHSHDHAAKVQNMARSGARGAQLWES